MSYACVMPDPWLSGEALMTSTARRVFSRALHRPTGVILTAFLVTTTYVAYRALRAPRYEASLYFRLAEGELTDLNVAPPPPSAIRDYISNVVLSLGQAEEIMKTADQPGSAVRDRVAAINDFREQIHVEVARNYFLIDRQPGDAPRSAQVTVSLTGSDPDRTRDALRLVGAAIVRDQAAQRSMRLAEAREILSAQIAMTRVRAKSLREETDRLWVELRRADARNAIDIGARIALLQAEMRSTVAQSLALEKRAADVSLSAAAENERLGLNFELFDESVEASSPHLTPLQLTRRAAIVFAIALLLTSIVAGAFDDRIYAPADLAAHGLPLFGALPSFPGDDAGSYRARTPIGRP